MSSGRRSLHDRVRDLRASVGAAFVVVGFALFVDMMIYGMIVPILPAISTSLGLSEGAIGALFGSYAVAHLLATPAFGVWTDRQGPRAPMLFGLLGLGAATLFFAFAEGFFSLMLARFLQGTSAAATWTAGLALLAERAPEQDRGKLMGAVMTFSSMGMLLGPPLGGFVYEWGGYEAPFLLAALFAILDGAARAMLIEPSDWRIPSPTRLLELLGSGRALLTLAVVLVASSIFTLLEPTLPLHLERELGSSPTQIGLLFAVITLLYAIASPAAGALTDRFGSPPVMLVGLLICSLCLPAMALSRSVYGFAIACGALGVGAAFSLAPTLPEIASLVEDQGGDTFGKAYGAFNVAYAAGMVIGPLFGGWGMQSLGFGATVTACGAVAGLVMVVLAVYHFRTALRGRRA